MRQPSLLFIAILFIAGHLYGQTSPLPPRPAVVAAMAPFYHGVASGDPWSDRVIIWTRVTTQAPSTSVDWQMATDTGFANVIQSGTFVTDTSRDNTVKIDVTGLQANSWYYYRFAVGSIHSMTGRTRTLPVGDVDSLRFAVFSCSDFQTGYFNAYHDIANRNDLDAIIHLGDWFYEYKAGGSDYQNDTDRLHPLSHDIYTLADYRLQHSQYRLDQDLRDMLQQYPLIYVWDDHDVANNSWSTGAENHDQATEGPWAARDAAGHRAHFEWMTVRPLAPGNDTIIHRSFKWGNLINLIMLDTRLEARDSSLGTGISQTNTYLTDTNRQMLGANQLAWFKNELSDTTTQWRVVGNQVMISPLTALNLVLNGDQWDGYPAERRRVFDHIMQNKIRNVVFLSGDIHSSWADDLPHPDSTYVSATGAGSVGTEFIGSSITSSATSFSVPQQVIQLANPQDKYVEFTKRGYLLFDVNKQRVQGDFIHLSNIASRTYSTSDDAQWMNLDGERHLRTGQGLLGPRPGNPPLLPAVQVPTAISETVPADMILLNCFPNPAANEVALQYYLYDATDVSLMLTDMSGRQVYTRTIKTQPGLISSRIYLDGYAAGQYIVTVTAGSKTYSKPFVISR